jgi:hypothetical protein
MACTSGSLHLSCVHLCSHAYRSVRMNVSKGLSSSAFRQVSVCTFVLVKQVNQGTDFSKAVEEEQIVVALCAVRVEDLCQHKSAYVSMRQQTSAYVSICQNKYVRVEDLLAWRVSGVRHEREPVADGIVRVLGSRERGMVDEIERGN